MEFAIRVGAPRVEKDKHLLQCVNHRATTLVIGIRNMLYEERMNQLELSDPYDRRIRDDLILTFMILHVPNHPLRELSSPVLH